MRRGVLAAVRALHKAGVVHGDLAPRNIHFAATNQVPGTSASFPFYHSLRSQVFSSYAFRAV